MNNGIINDATMSALKCPQTDSMARTRANSTKRKLESLESIEKKPKLICEESSDNGENSDEEETPPPPSKKIVQRLKKLNAVNTPINYNLRFEDLGGLQDQIALLRDSIIFRQENAAALKKAGLSHTVGGILLEGPPGTGKTQCAHTIAAELSRLSGKQYTFFTHNAVESFSKWMGESERKIRSLFEAAASCKPAIIFFDEFDAMCPRRCSAGLGTAHSYKTVVSTILSQLNNIQDNEVIVIATTNHKDSIDPAVLRHGRFDFIVHFPLPNEEQRFDILQVKLKNLVVQPEVITFLAKHTDGFSGASITFLCQEAKLNAFKRLKSAEDGKLKRLKSVEMEDFIKALRSANVPKIMASAYPDPLLDGIALNIASKMQQFLTQNHRGESPVTIRSNCFLVWSQDSHLVLNKMIVPKVMKAVGQSAFVINQSSILKHQNWNAISCIEAFSALLNQAMSHKILLVENIDAIYQDIPPQVIYEQLGFLGADDIFVFVTAATSPSSLPQAVQKLFKGSICERAFHLPQPSEQEIYDCFDCVWKEYVQPILQKCCSKNRKLASTKALIAQIMDMDCDLSYELLDNIRSHIPDICLVSEPSELADKLSDMLQQLR